MGGAAASVAGRYPLKQAVIDVATLATHEIVAAVAGKSVRVVSIMFTCGGAVNLTWQSDATDLTGPMEFADGGGLTHNHDDGVLWTAPGEALNLDSDAAVQISGVVTYVEVPSYS